jgi:hypothetical protein
LTKGIPHCRKHFFLKPSRFLVGLNLCEQSGPEFFKGYRFSGYTEFVPYACKSIDQSIALRTTFKMILDRFFLGFWNILFDDIDQAIFDFLAVRVHLRLPFTP